MARPYRPNPRIEVVFGRPPGPAKEGVYADGERVYRPNPPDPKEGITLQKSVRGRLYWRGLDKTDQLSQAEAAAFLRVSRMQVNRWVRAGTLKDRKILGTSRIAVAELLRFAKANGIELRTKGTFLTG